MQIVFFSLALFITVCFRDNIIWQKKIAANTKEADFVLYSLKNKGNKYR